MTARPVDEKFGRKLQELRQRRGYTVRQLARAVNMDPTYLSKLERGLLPPPSAALLSALAVELGMRKLAANLITPSVLSKYFRSFERNLIRFVNLSDYLPLASARANDPQMANRLQGLLKKALKRTAAPGLADNPSRSNKGSGAVKLRHNHSKALAAQLEKLPAPAILPCLYAPHHGSTALQMASQRKRPPAITAALEVPLKREIIDERETFNENDKRRKRRGEPKVIIDGQRSHSLER